MAMAVRAATVQIVVAWTIFAFAAIPDKFTVDCWGSEIAHREVVGGIAGRNRSCMTSGVGGLGDVLEAGIISGERHGSWWFLEEDERR